MAKISTLVDSFNTLDAAKWGTTYGVVEASRGQLAVSERKVAYSGVVSATTWDLTNSSVSLRVVPLPSTAAGRETSVSFYTNTSNGLWFAVAGNPKILMMRSKVGGTNSDASIPYDPVAHAWLRIRTSGTTVYWDTSPDGTVWTNRRTATSALTMTALTMEMSAGQWQAETGGLQTAYFDHLNILPVGAAFKGADAGQWKDASDVYVSNQGGWERAEQARTSVDQPAPDYWVRPSDWLATNVTPGQQKIQMLVAVFDGTASNYLSVRCVGAYTVDWGDGSGTQNIATNVTATHAYTWASVAGTTTTEGFRQALVTITPQAGNLTSLILNLAYVGTSNYSPPVLEIIVGPSTITTFSITPLTTAASGIRCRLVRNVEFLSPVSIVSGTQYLFNYCTALRRVAGQITLAGAATYTFNGCANLVEFPTLNTTAVTNFSYMFGDCILLTKRNMPTMDTGNATSLSHMFDNCVALTEGPTLNTVKATDMSYMFYRCYSLVSVPVYNTAVAANLSWMFHSCYSLVSAPAFSTTTATNTSYMYQTCRNLTSVPSYDLGNVVTNTNMFSDCASLRATPPFNFVKSTSLNSVFSSCYNLETVGAITVGAVLTSMTSTFANCYRLVSIAPFVGPTGNVTVYTGAFQNCYNLVKIPALDYAKCTSLSNLFSYCFAAEKIEGTMDWTLVTTMVNPIQNCRSLRALPFTANGGPRFSFSIAGTMLDQAAVEALYTSLPSISAQTITVSNVWGAYTASKPIATAKGWTVTGP